MIILKDFSLIQGFCVGIEIYWKGDLLHEDDWGFILSLGIIQLAYLRCNDINNLPEYGR